MGRSRIRRFGLERRPDPLRAALRRPRRAVLVSPRRPAPIAGRRPRGIVQLWSLAADAEGGGETDPGERFDRQQARGFYSLLFLAQALARACAASHLAAVTAGVHAVTGGERLCPQRATVLGPCLVLPQEAPDVVCRSFDLELDGDAEALRGQAELLAVDLLAGPRPAGDTQVAVIR